MTLGKFSCKMSPLRLAPRQTRTFGGVMTKLNGYIELVGIMLSPSAVSDFGHDLTNGELNKLLKAALRKALERSKLTQDEHDIHISWQDLMEGSNPKRDITIHLSGVGSPGMTAEREFIKQVRLQLRATFSMYANKTHVMSVECTWHEEGLDTLNDIMIQPIN